MNRVTPERSIAFGNDTIDIYDWPQRSEQPVDIPPHRAGVAVDLRRRGRGRGRGRQRFTIIRFPLMLGLDNTLLFVGLRRKLIVLPPGDYLFEVRDPVSNNHHQSIAARPVTASAGQLAELEFIQSHYLHVFGGHFSPKPAKNIGTHAGLKVFGLSLYWTGLCVASIFIAVQLRAPLGTDYNIIAALFVTFNFLVVFQWISKKIIDSIAPRRAYKDLAKFSDPPVKLWHGEAPQLFSTTFVPITDPSPQFAPDGVAGYFLGHNPPVTPKLKVGKSAFVIDFCLRYGMYPKGEVTSNLNDHLLKWAPQPEFAINGTPLPASWGVWFYEVPPGRNTITCSFTLPDGEGKTV